jgi:ribokinase
LEQLEAQGLHTDLILRDETEPSGVALIMVDCNGRNAIAVAPGSNRKITPEDIRRFEPLKGWGETLLLQLEVPLDAVKEALTLARMQGLRTILNPAPARTLDEGVLAQVDLLTPNEGELERLSGSPVKEEKTAVEACKILLDQGVGEVIVTLGEHGALHVTRKGAELFPGYPVKAVDTTAAGDAFNGALACGLAEGRPMEDAIRFANAAGALTVTRRGAQDALPSRDEIENLLQRLDEDTP